MPQSLPIIPPLVIQGDPTGMGAYETCLRIEGNLQRAHNFDGKQIDNDLVYVRILGYLLHHSPSDQGLSKVILEITSIGDDDAAVLQVGKMYYDGLVLAFGCTKSIPKGYVRATGPSKFETVGDMIKVSLNEDLQDPKKLALIRDNFRCMVSGIYDTSVLSIKEQETLVSGSCLPVIPTRAVYIFDPCTNQEIHPDSYKMDHAALNWDVLRTFGYEDLAATLQGKLVNRLENVLTLNLNFAAEFERFNVWFVATAVENHYKLEAAGPYRLRQYPEYVTFTTPDQGQYPVPDPTYLRIHAAFSKIAYLSGAAEAIDDLCNT